MNDEIVYVDPTALIPHADRDRTGSVLNESDGTYKLIKESIEAGGITDPIKVQSGTNVIIGGHTRHRIAMELGLREVPVRYYDVHDKEALYMMVRDNFQRIGDEKDPIKLARSFRIIVKEDGFPHGRFKTSGEDEKKAKSRKTLEEIAELFNMKKSNFMRYLSLLNLIQPFQDLVSEEKIGVKTGSILSKLTADNQWRVCNSIPSDAMKKTEYRLTENEAKSYVEAFGVSVNKDDPDGNGSELRKDEDLELAEQDGQKLDHQTEEGNDGGIGEEWGKNNVNQDDYIGYSGEQNNHPSLNHRGDGLVVDDALEKANVSFGLMEISP